MTRPARPLRPGDTVRSNDGARGIVLHVHGREIYVRWHLPADEDTTPTPASTVATECTR